MSRRIITTQLQAGGAAVPPDGYFDKVLKYIPADINAAWVAITGIIGGSAVEAQHSALLWGTFVVFVALTALWTLRQTTEPGKLPARTQTAVATGAFIVWVIALGGPFATLSGYQPVYGAVLLIIYTLAVGLINPAEDRRP
jgi:hypothetical protein